MSRPKPGAVVRAAAARVVARVLRDHVPADAALLEAPQHEPRDAALLAALVFGTLRWHHRLQWQANALLNRPMAARNAELAALLRVGLFQLEHLRIPDHAAVSATVDAAALIGRRDSAGVVNAVLRRFQRERALLDVRMRDDEEACYSHPAWLIAALKRDWPDAWQSILSANNEQGPLWLRVNLARTTRAEYLAKLRAAGIEAVPDDELSAAIRLTTPMPAMDIPGFSEGLVSVQDAAAQLAAGYLNLAPGQRVLDACAAPGGKTAHMLEHCPGLAEVWALDRDAVRLGKVRENLERLDLEAKLLHADAEEPAEWWDGVPFDRVLIDAPCSAVGVIRRHPDIKVLRSVEDVEHAMERQDRLLRALWKLVAPGGRLLYATCSVLRCENEERVAAFAAEASTGDAWDFRNNSGFQRQILPGEAQMDGFYYAGLLNDGSRAPSVSSPQHS